DAPPRGVVRAIAEDDVGRIWIGGATALYRYDPKAPARCTRTFTTADGLPSEFVTALARDKSGRMWVGTTKGLCYHDAAAESAGRKPFVSTRLEKVDRMKDLAPGARHATPMGAARRVESSRPATFPRA